MEIQNFAYSSGTVHIWDHWHHLTPVQHSVSVELSASPGLFLYKIFILWEKEYCRERRGKEMDFLHSQNGLETCRDKECPVHVYIWRNVHPYHSQKV